MGVIFVRRIKYVDNLLLLGRPQIFTIMPLRHCMKFYDNARALKAL